MRVSAEEFVSGISKSHHIEYRVEYSGRGAEGRGGQRKSEFYFSPF